MGFSLFGGNKNKISADTSVAITEAGQQTAQQFDSDNAGLDFIVLSKLCERSPSSAKVIAALAHVNTKDVIKSFDRLEGQGYVRIFAGLKM